MKICIRYALPALLMLAGCATDNQLAYQNAAAPVPTAAPPARVDAVSSALGSRMDDMLAGQPVSPAADMMR